MKKKQFYLILNKKNKYTFGAFPRNRIGKEAAVVYKEKLQKKHLTIEFIIK